MLQATADVFPAWAWGFGEALSEREDAAPLGVERECKGEPEAALEAAARGDREAFEALYAAHAGDVARLCRRMLASAEDAQDAGNEVFLRAWQALGTYRREQRPFRTWLLAVAAHHCIDRLRRGRRERQLFDPAELETLNLPARGPDPLQALAAREHGAARRAALDGLPLRFRAVLALRYFAEFSYAEIAEAVGATPNQVGVLLHRAKLRLREELAAERAQ